MATRGIQMLDRYDIVLTGAMAVHPLDGTIIYQRIQADVATDKAAAPLWRMDIDGGNCAPLLDEEGSQGNPIFTEDGTQFAWIAAHEDKAQLHIAPFADGRIDQQGISISKLDVTPTLASWSPDGSKIAFKAFVSAVAHWLEPLTTRDGWAKPPLVIDHMPYKIDGAGYQARGADQLFVFDVVSGAVTQLTDDPQGVGGLFYSHQPVWSRDGQELFVVCSNVDNTVSAPRRSDIYAISVAGEKRRVTQVDGVIAGYELSPDGERLAFAACNDQTCSSQTFGLYFQDMTDGVVTPVQPDLDLSVVDFFDNYGRPMQWHTDGASVMALMDIRGQTQLRAFGIDGSMQVLVDDISQGASGYGLGCAYAPTPDGHVVFNRGKADEWPEIRSTNGATLTSHNDDLAATRALGSHREILFHNPDDGQELQGWLFTPPEFDDSASYPLILEIHGGPHACFGPRFWPRLQSMLAQGYCVLITNPRGSTGYGHAFANMVQGDYPHHDVQDLLAGVDAACSFDFIDTDRVFVTGISGGGVLTCALVTQTDRFRAAAALCPFVELASQRLGADVTPFMRNLFPGEVWDNPDKYQALSPIYHANKVTTPTMLQAGDLDHRTPLSHAELFYQALKVRGVDTVLVNFEGENHGTSARPSHGMQSVELLLNWFNHYNVD